jgi:hypothetical protein
MIAAACDRRDGVGSFAGRFRDDDIGVMQDGLVQERDHFEIETMSALRAKRT